MANTLITPFMIAKEALMQLENNLVFANRVHREYKSEFTGGQGSTVAIRRPVKFQTVNGAVASLQDVEEKSTNIVVDQRKHVAWEFNTNDLTLSIEEYSERYIKPAAITLAQTVDRSIALLYRSVWNAVGTPGTTPNSFASVALAAQRMDEMAVEMSDRSMAYDRAMVGTVANFDMYQSQNIVTHTVGPLGGSPLIAGAAQNVTYLNAVGATWSQTLLTDGWTAAAAARLNAGDVITIAGVFAVNPVPGEGSKQALPYLQQFTVLNNVSSDGAGAATLTISPPIITSGPQQTVSAVPADNAAITVLGSANTGYPQNLGFHKNAFALVTVPLDMPDGVAFKARENHRGLSIRVLKDYDFTNDTDRIRMDILYGVKAIYPDLAARLVG
jgi:P22 coat protein - gene protein 5